MKPSMLLINIMIELACNRGDDEANNMHILLSEFYFLPHGRTFVTLMTPFTETK